jgi:hypothetical protein
MSAVHHSVRFSVRKDDEVRTDMTADGVAEGDQSVAFEADLRFSKQIYELQMAIAPGPFTEASSDALLSTFMDEYAKRYKGSIVLRTPVELVGKQRTNRRARHVLNGCRTMRTITTEVSR